MPIYEYQCQACGQCTEILQRISEAPLTTCPACQAPELQKLVSAASFHLKGSGWYVTDFKQQAKPPSGAATNNATATANTSDTLATTSDNGAKSDSVKGESAKPATTQPVAVPKAEQKAKASTDSVT